MSRILEYQYADEQTVVSRVLLELHQALDANFPGVGGAANRQFTKTVFSSQGEQTHVDGQPGQSQVQSRSPSVSPTDGKKGRSPSATAESPKRKPSGIDFSSHTFAGNANLTIKDEARWSILLTRGLLILFLVGIAVFAYFVYQPF